MHILVLTENFPPEVNASATRVFERAVYWVRSGCEVTVVTCFPNFPRGRLYDGWRQRFWRVDIVEGIRVIRLPTYMARNEGFLRRSMDFVSFMIAVVLASPWLPRPDVVVANSPQFFTAVAGWIVGGLKRRPFVFEIADLWPASIRAVGAMRATLLLDLLERLELFLYRRSRAIVALTPAFKTDLVRRGIDPLKIAVVINGVDLPRYSRRPKDPALVNELGVAQRFVVGYLGTLGLAHGLTNVVLAGELLREREDLLILFVGDGAAKPELTAASAMRRLDNVVFIDAQPKDRVPAYWSVCDVALIHLKNDPVFSEVIPSKMFEAMAMGLPLLIVAPPGEATAIVEREGAGVVVPASDPGALAQAIVQLATDRGLCRRLGDASEAAAARYTRQRQADHMRTVLERVVGNCELPGS